MEKNDEITQGKIGQLMIMLREKLPLDKVDELRKSLGEKINIPPEIVERGVKLRDKIIPRKEGDGGTNIIENYAPGVSELGAKIADRYTPTKGLIMVLCFLGIDLALQLYLVTRIATFEIVENSIRIDFVTVASFLTYALTMISILFILSEFFLMRRMEALFSIDEIKSIGNGQVEQFLEPALEEDLDIIEMPAPMQEEEPTDLAPLLNIQEEKEEIDPVFAALETAVEEDPDSKYKVLGVAIPEEELEEEEAPELDPWDFDFTPAPSKPVEPVKVEQKEEEIVVDMSNSEILATLSELKEVVKELKTRTGRT